MNLAVPFRILLAAVMLAGVVRHACAVDVGDQAKLKTVTLEGKPVDLAELKGKVVMVNFWATWCPVCKAEMPNWQRFYDANKNRGFELIAMSIDDDQSELAKHAKDRKFGFPIAWRWDDKTDDTFGDIIGTPTLFIVDKNGKVAWTKRGRVTQEQLAAIVEPLLN